MPILYTTKASATGGRAGRAVSENGVLDVTLTVPKELGGDGATGTNPEQLFAAGYSACFLGALKFVAGKEKVKIPERRHGDRDRRHRPARGWHRLLHRPVDFRQPAGRRSRRRRKARRRGPHRLPLQPRACAPRRRSRSTLA